MLAKTYNVSCKCGACSITVKPVLAFNCYCSNCAGAFSAAKSTVVASWQHQASHTGPLEFHKTSNSILPFVGVTRGSCVECKNPVFGYGRPWVIIPFSFVNRCPLGKEDIKNNCNIFIDLNREEYDNDDHNEGKEGVWNFYSDLGSLLGLVMLLVYGTFRNAIGVPLVKVSDSTKAE